MPLVFIVVTVQTQQFPVAAIAWIVVVIVVPGVDGEFANVRARELAAAAPADPGIELERLFPIAALALLSSATGFGDDAVQFARTTCAHAATWNLKHSSETPASDPRATSRASDRSARRSRPPSARHRGVRLRPCEVGRECRAVPRGLHRGRSPVPPARRVGARPPGAAA